MTQVVLHYAHTLGFSCFTFYFNQVLLLTHRTNLYRHKKHVSMYMYGAVFQQQIDGHWHPISYFSKKLSHPKHDTAHLTENSWQSTAPFAISAQLEDPDLPTLESSSSLRLSKTPVLASAATLVCDLSTGVPRPVVPFSFRRAVFDSLHSLSHPGVRATKRLITSRYTWPDIKRDVRR